MSFAVVVVFVGFIMKMTTHGVVEGVGVGLGGLFGRRRHFAIAEKVLQ